MSEDGLLFIGTWISGYYTQYVGVRADATHGSPDTAFDAYLDNGFMYMSTSLTWNCTTTGSFPISERTTTDVMISDGSARCYVAGDTVVLRKGLSGQWDIDWACEEALVLPLV